MRKPLFAAFVVAPSLALAAIQPTWPGGQDLVFRAGDICSLKYMVDTTGLWTSMAVDLMSGSNYNMVNVTSIATGVDGTVGAADGTAELNFTCPVVDPPAPIYFLQATQDGNGPVWTSRFTLAAPNGTVVPAPNDTQPDGESIPWGIGILVNSTETVASTAFTSNSTSAVLGFASTTIGGSDLPVTTFATTTAVLTGATPAATSANVLISGFQRVQSCDKSTPCPESAPCCSEEGYCGTGRNCLAGCDPLASSEPAACAPVPACVSGEYQLNANSANRILSNSSFWNGDATSFDWLVDKLGKPELGALTSNSQTGVSSLTLSLTESGNGTVLTSTRSLLYGNVTARIKSIASAGVLTSFALLSGTGDEIVYEFTTNATDIAHTAFFAQGDVDDYASVSTLNITDRAAEFHNFTIAWTPEAITWLVDGFALRNVSANSTDSYPQTPARIQFSIWAPGRDDQPEGLIDFAGGLVDWNASTYLQQGYCSSYISAVQVECYDTSLLSGTLQSNDSSASWASGGSTASSSTSETTTLWWTPPTVQTMTDGQSASSTSTSPTAWWTPASQRRRGYQLAKRSDASAVGSYAYGLDSSGALVVSGSNSPTTIGDDQETGLTMSGSPSALGSAVSGSSDSAVATTPMESGSATATPSTTDTASASASDSESSASASATSLTQSVQEKWESLGTAAHLGIYIGAAIATLFILVLIGWLCRKASLKHRAQGTPPPDAGGAYFPINDRGEMLPAGQIYSGGEIRPGENLYSGGQVPDPFSMATNAAAAAAQPLRRSSTSKSSRSKYTEGAEGYVPSSQLQQEYQVGYQPAAMRQV